MSFTDEDLKRLEEKLNDPVLTEFKCRAAVLNIRGLLTRLEAAEKCLGPNGPMYLDEWRKSKGAPGDE